MIIERNNNTFVYKIQLEDLIAKNLVVNDFIDKNNYALDFIMELLKKEHLDEKINKMHCLIDAQSNYPVVLTIGIKDLVDIKDLVEEQYNHNEHEQKVQGIKNILKDRKKSSKRLSSKVYIIDNLDILSQIIERTNMNKNICLYKINEQYYLDIQENRSIEHIDNILREYVEPCTMSTSYLNEHCDKKGEIEVDNFKKVFC